MENIKEYIIMDAEGVHDYDIKVEKNEQGIRYSIYASYGEHWREEAKGKLQLSMIDDGNKIVFNTNIKSLEYDLYFCLRALVGIEHAIDEPHVGKYKIIEKKQLMEL